MVVSVAFWHSCMVSKAQFLSYLFGMVSDRRSEMYFRSVVYSTLPFASKISPFSKTNLRLCLYWICIVQNKKMQWSHSAVTSEVTLQGKDKQKHNQ